MLRMSELRSRARGMLGAMRSLLLGERALSGNTGMDELTRAAEKAWLTSRIPRLADVRDFKDSLMEVLRAAEDREELCE